MRARILIPLAAVLVPATAFAQSSASATSTVTATIYTPITLSTTTNMNFGEVVMQGATGGTVVLPASTAVPTYTGVNAGGSASAPSAAVFSLGGTGSVAYTVSVSPSSVTLTSGSNTMTVGSFSQGVGSGTLGTLPAGGTQTLYVGGTLTVAANQAAGTYINNTGFTVTVAYQ